jgi:hypothetical protein
MMHAGGRAWRQGTFVCPLCSVSKHGARSKGTRTAGRARYCWRSSTRVHRRVKPGKNTTCPRVGTAGSPIVPRKRCHGAELRERTAGKNEAKGPFNHDRNWNDTANVGRRRKRGFFRAWSAFPSALLVAGGQWLSLSERARWGGRIDRVAAGTSSLIAFPWRSTLMTLPRTARTTALCCSRARRSC